jgi:uncharacterized protein (DUF2249 family)
MTTLSRGAGCAQPSGPADLTGTPLTLADEHLLLLGQVAARAGELLTVAARGRWPGAELAALLGYIRAEVLRQVSDEETLLFPVGAPAAAGGLARDHARLRLATEVLARAASGEQTLCPGQLAAAVRDFVIQLERHLSNEEELLATGRAPKAVPATGVLGGHPHEWYPLTERPAVDLDALPADQAVAAAVDRLLRMRRGERVELQSGTGLDPVWREISELSPDGYRFTVLQDGPVRWRMRVARRPAAD